VTKQRQFFPVAASRKEIAMTLYIFAGLGTSGSNGVKVIWEIRVRKHQFGIKGTEI